MGRFKLRLLLPAVVLAIGLLALAATLMVLRQPTTSGTSAIGGPFALTTQDGRQVTQADYAGAPFLVFFGYTHCPDVCPTTMFDLTQVFAKLGKDRKISALFISIDPERDTPAVLKAYLANFDPRITALTGSAAALQAVGKAYRVYARKVPGGNGDYTMDHTSLVYLMDKQGSFVGSFNSAQEPDKAAAELARYL